MYTNKARYWQVWWGILRLVFITRSNRSNGSNSRSNRSNGSIRSNIKWVSTLASYFLSWKKPDKEPFERFERFEPWAIIIKLVWSFERFERFERLTQEKCDKYNAMTSVISSLLIYLHSFDLIPYPTWRQLNPKWLTQAGIKYFQMRSQVGSHLLVPLSFSFT